MTAQSTARSASTEQPVTVPAVASKTPKVRSSCNACGAAKVKCDRGQPECRRCKTMSLSCVYGLSRNLGKPRRKRPGIGLEESVEKRRYSTRRVENGIETAVPSEPPSTNESAPGNRSDLAGDLLASGDGFNFMIGANDALASSSLYPIMPFEDWHQLGDLALGSGIPSAFLPDLLGTPRASDDSRETHSCPRESYEIFRDLICPSPTLHAPESKSVTVSAQLDEVLHFNRNAITRLSGLLKCPCAKSGHRAMVHASIVSRILIWYQQAGGLGSRPSASVDSLNPECTADSTSSSSSLCERVDGDVTESATIPQSLAQTTGFTVRQPPILMGNFGVEDEDLRAAFGVQLVISELKRMIPLIEMFTSQNSGDSLVASLYSHLGAWLRTEHIRTVGVLKNRLGGLNKSLES